MRVENESSTRERRGIKKTIYWGVNEDKLIERKSTLDTWAKEIRNTLWLWEKSTP